MSWLYSIIFAGLMFSSGDKLPIINADYVRAKVANVAVSNTADETERFEQTYPLNADGRVSIDNVNGSITVETWDRNEIKLAYIKTADSTESLKDVQVNINARKDSFTVETEYETLSGRKNRNYKRLEVEYHLTVPRGAVLSEIETVNGSVIISNAENTTKASAVNGEVRATNLRGRADLSTVNGRVVADFDQLQANSRISLETVNGTVELTIPSDTSAIVKADSVNGKITNDFNLPVRKGEYVGYDLHGKLGNGETQIRLSSVNGGLSIKRKNDGRSVSPAINLLNTKSDDGDSDENSRVRPPREPREPKIPREPRTPLPPKPPIVDAEQNNKDVEQSLKDSLKELDDLGTKLDAIDLKEIQEQARNAANIDSEKLKEQIRIAQEKYKESLKYLNDVNWTFGAPSIEKKSDSFTVKGTPKITVEAKNCDVAVRGWDKSEVSYSLVKINRRPQKQTDNVSNLSVTNTDSTVDIKVSMENRLPDSGVFDDAMKTRIEVFVPKKSNLKIVTDGEIRLEGVSGEIDLKGTNETVNVRDTDGKLSVATSEGRIRVIGFRGAFDGATADGMMNLEGDFQSLNARATAGTIVLTLPENADANLESNAEIESEGVNLIRKDAKIKSWRVGSGGKTYRMNVDDGKVIVRNANSLEVY